MNEKLKQEVAFFKCIGDNDLRDLTRIAEHFYNLALEDVRKEVESNRNAVKCLSTGSSFNEGKLVMAHDILFFINNLTK